ncbi:tryptophan synthase subunit alpha [Brachybacterium ginsengisoli]|uniref:Tryptophan synthase alpha chain n=1 Tax=Brachybacterium ginsengisoli TaxID=1331682 RepID=A0A291GXN5_9MICO|nr:tryptophan synthase subunit alpha [Brachybacterium ginsengisoli]ATG54965.1 tryptophan synthase subunit alpha [Brachybacterium ginsengisoli]
MTTADTVRLRADEVLDRARSENRAALIAYLPVGYPDLERSIEAARILIDHGADMIELGLPYSDPVMDGAVIQQAASASLAGGTRTRHVLEAVEALSGRGAAILVMSYWNPILAYGPDAFARDLAAAGGAGVITPDLIPDEGADWIAASDRHGVDRVFLVAPSSPRDRLQHVVSHTRGFVYAASTMGVTGTRASVSAATEGLVERTRLAGAKNVCVGLGVSNGEQASQVGAYADGVIVGSAFVRALLENEGDDAAARTALAAVADDLRAGVERARTQT